MSLSELNKIDPDPISTLINKLIVLKGELNTGDLKRLNEVGCILSLCDRKNTSNGLILPKGVCYDASHDAYYARRIVDGKRIYIKSSPDPKIVAAALRDFCIQNNLEM